MYQRKVAVVVLMAFMLCSCASMQGNTVTTYEGVGDSMVVVRDALISACKDELISASDCEKLRVEYNKIEALRVQSGTVLANLIEMEASLKALTQKIQESSSTDLVAEKAKLLDKFYAGINDYNKLLADINNLIQSLIEMAKGMGVKF